MMQRVEEASGGDDSGGSPIYAAHGSSVGLLLLAIIVTAWGQLVGARLPLTVKVRVVSSRAGG